MRFPFDSSLRACPDAGDRLDRIVRAVNRLKLVGEPLAKKRICKTAGMSENTLKRYPEATQYLENAIREDRALRKANLVENRKDQIRQTASTMLAESKPLKRGAIAARIGCDAEVLSYFDETDRLLAELIAEDKSRRREALATAHNVLGALSRAKAELEAHDQPVSRSAVIKKLGVPVALLRSFPEVSSALDRIAGDYRLARAEFLSRSRTELVDDVQNIINQMRISGTKVTQTAVAKTMEKSAAALVKYPEIRALFQENNGKGPVNRSSSADSLID